MDCAKCGGSGLWQGPAHGRGAFTECPACAGKGWTDLQYERFIRIKTPKEVWGQDAVMVFPSDMADKAVSVVSDPPGENYADWLKGRV
jgi:hypothetical protein